MGRNSGKQDSRNGGGWEREALPLGVVGWWTVLLALAVYGVFFVYSTGYIGPDYPVKTTWVRHIIWLVVGLGGSLAVSRLLPRSLAMRLLVWGGYGLSLTGLVAVLVAGMRLGGARRWLSCGPLMLQPAEFAKVFTLLAVCWVLSSAERGGHSRWLTGGWRRFLVLLLLVGAPFVLIALEPSVGNAFSLLPGTLAAMCVHGMWRGLWNALLLLLVVGMVTAEIGLTWIRQREVPLGETEAATEAGKKGVGQPESSGLFRAYHLRRLGNYLQPQGGWNERQSVMTLASGGLTGKGYLEGMMKSLGYLPRTVAPTDFIFSVIGEEMGFLFGTLPILLLYGGMLSLGLHWGGRSGDEATCLNCVALVTLLCTHVLVNVGMTVRLVPIIGMPLPLLSYGGSFTLAICVALGMIYGAGRRYYLEAEPDEQSQAAESRLSLGIPGLLRFNIVKKPRRTAVGREQLKKQENEA